MAGYIPNTGFCIKCVCGFKLNILIAFLKIGMAFDKP